MVGNLLVSEFLRHVDFDEILYLLLRESGIGPRLQVFRNIPRDQCNTIEEGRRGRKGLMIDRCRLNVLEMVQLSDGSWPEPRL